MPKKPKRSKRVKQSVVRPGSIKQLQPQVSIPSQEQLVDYAQLARQHMLMGNFAGCISTCELALNSLPRHSGLRLEILALLGLAHGMLKHYQQSYDIFSEAIGIDPTRAELWYNHGLACHSLARYAEAVQDFEQAVALSKNDKSEMASKFAVELKEGRRELQEAMQAYGMDITFEQYMEIEKRFTQALSLSKQEKWQEAELLFRQLTRVGSRIPSYWTRCAVSALSVAC